MEAIRKVPVLTTEQQLKLCSQFTVQEIKNAMFSIPNMKSLGPDGYNSGFYKSSWSIIGPLVCAAVKEFFETATMPKYFGATKLAILPKVLNP